MKKNIKKRKYFLGGIDPITATSGIASIGLQIAAGVKARNDFKNSAKSSREMIRKSNYDADNIALDNFELHGDNKSFYRKGGIHKLNSRKGLIPLDDNKFIVKGNKHSEGGVKVLDAEVEDGEVLKFDNNRMSVLSDADSEFGYSPAEQSILNMKRGINPDLAFHNELNKQESMKNNKSINKNKKFKKGVKGFNLEEDFGIATNQDEHALRWNAKNTKPLKSIDYNLESKPFEIPGISTNHKELPNMQTLRQFNYIQDIDNDNDIDTNKHINDFSPFIDNVANAVGTFMTPKVNKPIANKMVNLNTDVNIDPAMQDIQEGERSINKFATSSFADSQTAGSLIQRSGNAANQQRQRIRSEAFNTEAGLRNQETMVNAQIQQSNNAKAEQYGREVNDRSKGIIENLSENAANLSDDITKMKNNKKLEKYQDKQLLYNIIEKGDTNAIANALVLDPESFEPVILDRYEQLTGIDSPLDENLKNNIISAYGKKVRQMKESEQKKIDNKNNRRESANNIIGNIQSRLNKRKFIN